MTRTLSITVLLLGLLAGCGPLVTLLPPSSPASLYTLSAVTLTPPLTTPLWIGEPDVPAELRSHRIAVRIHNHEIQYLKGATWTEQPARLFRRMLTESLRSTITDPQSPTRLTGTLTDFHLDARRAALVAVVRYSVVAGRAQQSFEARIPVASSSPADVVAALDAASHQVIRALAVWLNTQQSPR